MKRFAIALAVVALAALGVGDTWAQQRGGGGGGRPPSGGGKPPQGSAPGHGGHYGGSHGGYRGHWSGHSGHSHSHWYGGVYLGSPWAWGWPYYGWGWDWGWPYYRPYSYGYSYYEPAPSVYVERSVSPEAEAAPAQPIAWYYCTDPAGYYPYVQNCKVLWVPVKPFGPSAGGDPATAPAAPSYSTQPSAPPGK